MDHELIKVEYTVHANLREASQEDYEDLNKYAKGFALAAGAPPIQNGKPRMVFMSAWIAHEGRNLNGDAFVKEELESRVEEGLFIPPYSGMVDLDHDFVARGFWYKAALAFDERVKKWGIFAHGALWAWRFPELSDTLLAEMHRNGFINVSMAALSESLEITMNHPEAEGTHTRVLHNPIFLATTVLTVPPGDENAQGVASENPEDLEPTPESLALASHSGTMEESNMENELNELKEAIGQILANNGTSEKAFSLVQTFYEAQKEALEKVEEEKGSLEAKLAEMQTEKASLEVALESAKEVQVTLEQELTETKEKLAAFEAEKQEAEEAERLDTRLSELPDVVIDNLEKHPDKNAVLANWRKLDDESWKELQGMFTLANASSFKSKSDEEGRLGVFGTKTGGQSLKAFLK